METMDLQTARQSGNDGIGFRIVSSMLLFVATLLLAGSLFVEHPVNASPNSGRLTINKSI